MLLRHLALVSQSSKIKFSELLEVSSALQKQISRDLGPIWNIHATIDPFETIKKVPVGYWPIIIQDKIDDPEAAGYHSDKNHQPFAVVEYSKDWSLTVSHEVCEMLVDPWGNKLVASESIKKGQGRVQYLVEVCDPCESAKFAYTINGVQVSDFYTPHFFDPVVAKGVRYSFTNSIAKPRQIRKDGYLSWYDPSTQTWWQATYFRTSVAIEKLEGMEKMQGSLRSKIDRLTKPPKRKPDGKFEEVRKGNARASDKAGEHWEKELKRLYIKRK